MSKTKSRILEGKMRSTSLWTKETLQLPFVDRQMIHEGYLSRYSKSQSGFKPSYFLLTTEALLYVKRPSSSKVFTNLTLDWVQVHYEETEYEGTQAWLVLLLKGLKYSRFIIKDLGEFAGWKKALARVCVQTDFNSTFRLKSVIGKGAFGCVYLAKCKKDGKKYAVKKYAKAYVDAEPQNKNAVLNEVKILRSLKHPNIPKLESVYEGSSSIYLVQELVKGISLADKIDSIHMFTAEEIAKVSLTLLTTLSYLHGKDILHRDVKPANILVMHSSDNRIVDVKLIDFGFSVYASTKNSNYLCGTPGYIAPELLGKRVNLDLKKSSKIDVFSLGVVIFAMAQGRSPFIGGDKSEILELNKRCGIFYSQEKLSPIQHLDSLLRAMLNPEPHKRVSVQEALNHEFFKTFASQTSNLDASKLGKKAIGGTENDDSFIRSLHDVAIEKTNVFYTITESKTKNLLTKDTNQLPKAEKSAKIHIL